jgi:hypothetical protein
MKTPLAKLRTFLLINLLLLGSLASLGLLQPAQAADAGNWSAGHIIDDQVFNNKDAMSPTDIQNFLNSKVPTCDTNHPAGPSNQGAQPPWTCLKNYYENTTSHANNLNNAGVPAGAISAAQIIYNDAQQFNINPQVLLVTLQKENGLITDTWPYPWQFRTAMGFACPDSSACDPAFFGFAQQVYQGARHLRNFADGLNNANWFTPYTVGVRNISYSPTGGCGSSAVNITNGATAALYSYTPYQPNAAALANLYGSGDGCSAYGNRNFWRDFTDWFGSTLSQGSVSPLPSTWSFEALSGSTSSINQTTNDTGHNPAAIQFGTNLHTFYYDATAGVLKHAVAGSGGWTFETLDGAGGANGRLTGNNLGQDPSITIFNNTLHVFYYNSTAHTLRHAWSADGASWQFETLDGVVGANGRIPLDVGLMSTATSYSGTLQVFYYSASLGDLRHAWMDSQGTWRFETLDGSPGTIGKWNADLGLDPVTVAYGTTLQLFYYDAQNGNLRHAWSDTTGWHFENLDGDPGSIGHWNVTAGATPYTTSIGGTLYVFYYDSTSSDLRVAWSDVSGWHFNVLDGNSSAASGATSQTGIDPVAATYNGSLQLFYLDTTNSALRHAFTTP